GRGLRRSYSIDAEHGSKARYDQALRLCSTASFLCQHLNTPDNSLRSKTSQNVIFDIRKGRNHMKRLVAISCLFVLCGCASMYSQYELYHWCLIMGSSRPADIGATAQNRATCNNELAEDLADQTHRILYVPRDVIMSIVIV